MNNISFVVIARNECFAVDKCLKVLVNAPLKNCEIICVDSESSDCTLQVMRNYAENCSFLRIYHCTGHVNSAIARNIGLGHATKDFVYFVDGDIELNIQFIAIAMDYFEKGAADILTGQLSEIYYTDDYKTEIGRIKDRFSIANEKRVFYSGGCFIARRSVVNRAGIWNENMIRNQDIEYTMRLARHGRFLAIPGLMGTHHTLEYSNRAWEYLKKGYPKYFGFIIRKNILRPEALLFLFMRNQGFLLGLIFFIGISSCLLISKISGQDLNIYLYALSILFFADMIIGIIKRKKIVHLLITHYLYAPLILIGIASKYELKKSSQITNVIKIV